MRSLTNTGLVHQLFRLFNSIPHASSFYCLVDFWSIMWICFIVLPCTQPTCTQRQTLRWIRRLEKFSHHQGFTWNCCLGIAERVIKGETYGFMLVKDEILFGYRFRFVNRKKNSSSFMGTKSNSLRVGQVFSSQFIFVINSDGSGKGKARERASVCGAKTRWNQLAWPSNWKWDFCVILVA